MNGTGPGYWTRVLDARVVGVGALLVAVCSGSVRARCRRLHREGLGRSTVAGVGATVA